MLGTDATFGDVALDCGREPRQALIRSFLPRLRSPWPVASACGSCTCVRPRLPRSSPPDAPAPARRLRPAANPYGAIIVDPSFLVELRTAAPAPDVIAIPRLEAFIPAPSAAIPLPRLDAFAPAAAVASAEPGTVPPLPPSRACRRITRPCRRSAMFPKSPTSRPCRRRVRPNSRRRRRPPRRSAIGRNETPGPLAPLPRPTIAAFWRSCSGSGANRGPLSPPGHRTAATRPRRRTSAGPATPSSASRVRSRATTDLPPSMTSPPAPSICPTERDWKPIPATATSSTTLVT